jgi:hypothetical protein
MAARQPITDARIANARNTTAAHKTNTANKKALPRDPRGSARVSSDLFWSQVELVSLVTSAATAATTAAVAAASATTAAATTAVAAATTAAAATAAATTLFTRPGFVHGQGPSVVLGAVDAGNRRLGFGIASHFNKAKALASARVAVVDDLGALHRPELRKHLIQI